MGSKPMAQKSEKLDVIAHYDRGSLYTSTKYRKLLDKHNITQSVGRTGSCKAELQVAIFSWVDLEYNRDRFYSSVFIRVMRIICLNLKRGSCIMNRYINLMW